MKRIFQPRPQAGFASCALLVLRLVIGAAFMMHGWGKIQHPWNWMGPQAPTPGFLQFCAALSEFGGGLAWILGFLTPLACVGIGCTMSVAIYTHMIVLKDPFVASKPGGSYELASAYWCVALLLFALGPGKLSLDQALFGRRTA